VVALIESKSGYRVQHEETLAVAALTAARRPHRLASLKQVERRKVDLNNIDLAVGSLQFVSAALRAIGVERPDPPSYPLELAAFLHRKILGARLDDVRDMPAGSVFIKPAARTKRFTGFVLGQGQDWRLHGVPGHEAIWCSEVVHFTSEWRYYVVAGAIRHVAYCDGNRAAVPDLATAQAAVDRYSASPDAPAGYAVDFGVLADGRTALVEMNDGFAIGAYDDIPPAVYLDMLQARWDQLTKAAVQDQR